MNIKIIGLLIVFVYIYFTYLYTPYVFHLDSKKKGTRLFILGSVHGNEPAGTHAAYKLINLFKEKRLKLTKGSITILPLPNPLGSAFNSRFQLKLENSDINRNFQKNGKDRISKIIISYIKKNNFVIDLHEGWGFHKLHKRSIGSTITNTTSKKTKIIAKNMLNSINSNIKKTD